MRVSMILMSALSATAAWSANIEQVIVRQQWPWSTDVKVEYKLSGVTSPVDIGVAAYNGDTPLDASNLDASITGVRFGINEDGVGKFTIDPVRAFGTEKVALANFRVKLTVVDASASMTKPLYKIVNLATGVITDVTTAELLNGAHGAVETGGQTIAAGAAVDETRVYWTGVTNKTDYSTSLLVLRRVPAAGATFTMGSPTGEPGRSVAYSQVASYLPRGAETQHEVSFMRDFYIGVYEMTQKQYNLLVGTWPSKFTADRDSRPVEQVSWSTVTGTCLPALKALTGKDFLLPTEAQWEFAYRAGMTTGLHNGREVSNSNAYRLTNGGSADPGLITIARYFFNAGNSTTATLDSSRGTAKVGSYRCNNWGLYDMAGNVCEWCSDYYTEDLGASAAADPAGPAAGDEGYESYRVLRNGSIQWNNYGNCTCRAAFRRGKDESSFASVYAGFRVVLMAE